MRRKRCLVAGSMVTLLLLVILAGVLYHGCQGPVLKGAKLPDYYEEAVLSQAMGLYSQKLPLVPVLVRVDAFSEETVHYTIFYFPFGSVGMSYNRSDGYNIEKPLSRL